MSFSVITEYFVQGTISPWLKILDTLYSYHMRQWVFGIIILFFLLFSFVPTFYELSEREKLPSSRSFELVHNYYSDYHFYLSRIREGYEGRFTVVERYTSEPHAGSFLQVFYLILGWIARVVPDSAFTIPAIYHVARFVFGGLFLLLVVSLSKKLFFSLFWQILGVLTVATASTLPTLVMLTDGGYRLGGYMPWFTYMDSLQRLTFLPHILVGQCLILFLIMMGLDAKYLDSFRQTLALGIFGIFLTIVFPPGIVFVGIVYGVSLIFSFFLDRVIKLSASQQRQWTRTHLLFPLLIGIMALPFFAYFQSLFTFYPWKRLLDFGTLYIVPLVWIDYARALGLTLLFGMFGMMVGFFKKDRHVFALSCWVIGWMSALFIFSFIPQQPPLRFTEMAPHVPLGLLTVYFFYSVIRWLGTFRTRFVVSSITSVVYVLLFIPIVLGLGTMHSSWLWQKDFINLKVIAGYPSIPMNNYIVYPGRTFMDAIVQLSEKTNQSTTVVVSLFTAGNFIPAFSGRVVYVGHDNTVNKEEKLASAQKFYSHQMTVEEAQSFLLDSNITHVFFGPEEQEKSGNLFSLTEIYPFLQELYRVGDVGVYIIKN